MLRRAAVAGLKGVAALADVLRPDVEGVVVLLYHQVGGPRSTNVNLSAAAFEQQVEHLVATGTVHDLDGAVDVLQRDRADADRAVRYVVTFDDGTADFVDHALPVLVEHHVPATLYVATRWIEEQRSFWDDGTVLSWSALADALSTGLVTIGSHTHSHVLLDRLDPATAAGELDRSIDLIGDRLGVEAAHFAYPKALPPSAATERLVRERFASAALAGTRPNPIGATDVHRLARSPVQVDDRGWGFRRKAAGGMELEDRVREVLNRRRYAGATS